MTLTDSRVTGNSGVGIYVYSASDITVYNNYFNNPTNVGNNYPTSGDIWNTTLTPGTNIMGGSWIGGNYWAEPDGMGFSQNNGDSNNDGICDNAYSLPGGSDQLPLHIPQSSYQVSVPGYITSPGTYYLQNDIASTSNGIQITSGNVVFDGMGHTIQGLGSGGATGILVNKPNVIVKNVTVTGWYTGISYQSAPNGGIEGVNVSSNSWNGIDLESSSGVDINGSEVSGNSNGIYLVSSSDGMTLTDSRVTGNSGVGIYVYSASDITVYNNYFNNPTNVGNNYPTSGDIWNTTLTPGTNIMGGSWIGGNYWAAAGRHGLLAE